MLHQVREKSLSMREMLSWLEGSNKLVAMEKYWQWLVLDIWKGL